MLDLFQKEDESNFKYVCFYTLAVYTGFRLGELIGLEWKGLQDIQRKKVGSKWIETDRVFTKWNGLTLDRSAPGYYFKKFCERTGMRYVSNHSMRHLNASLLINAGVDVKTVQSCLGHSMAATTVNISYGHTVQSSYISI